LLVGSIVKSPLDIRIHNITSFCLCQPLKTACQQSFLCLQKLSRYDPTFVTSHSRRLQLGTYPGFYLKGVRVLFTLCIDTPLLPNSEQPFSSVAGLLTGLGSFFLFLRPLTFP
jgi:hypothetical protein